MALNGVLNGQRSVFFRQVDRCTGEDADRPRVEEARLLQPVQLARDDDERALQHVVSFGRTHYPRHEAVQRRLNAPENSFQGLAIAKLRTKNAAGFVRRCPQCGLILYI